jgi:hypothetical protein
MLHYMFLPTELRVAKIATAIGFFVLEELEEADPGEQTKVVKKKGHTQRGRPKAVLV